MRNLESYKNQEIALVLLNIGVLAALFGVHIVFLFQLGPPSAVLLATLAARVVILILELVWLQRLETDAGGARLRRHAVFSIWLNIAFAFVASVFGGTPDSHYSVLMVIPIVQAAYRFDLKKTMAIVAVTIALTLLGVWLYFRARPPVEYGEFFEAATVSLIFFVVGFVVRLLVGNLRDEEAKLQRSLAELETTQARLVAEEKMAAVGQLSSAIAHEIRNPVAMIASSLELAARQPENAPLRAEMFGIATAEAKRLERLTDDFLAYARVKKPETKKRPARETLEYVAGLAKARLAECRRAIELDCPADLQAAFDETQIRQALLNLVLNAAEAPAVKSGAIRLGAHETEGGVSFFVENGGAAIPPDEAAGIFEPFFTTKPAGTGLGLAIVRSIARAHGGDAVLARNEPGAVRFALFLPRSREVTS